MMLYSGIPSTIYPLLLGMNITKKTEQAPLLFAGHMEFVVTHKENDPFEFKNYEISLKWDGAPVSSIFY